MPTIKNALLLLLSIFLLQRVHCQLISDSFLIDGHYRTFHYINPLPNSSISNLIFVLHGSGGDGIKAMKKPHKLLEQSAQEHLLMVFPDGYKKNWNECRKEAVAAANQENIDEQTFFLKMIEYCMANFKINPKNVFVIGTSGGGHMAYKLGITIPEKFRAITAIVANLPDSSNMDCIESKKPMPVMIVNGTNDSTNPYNGGRMKGKGLVRSTDATFRYWSTLAGYVGEPIKESLPDTDPNDGKTIEKYTFKQKGKPEVVLYKVINGVHNTPNDIDVFQESWAFFKRQLELH